MPLGEYFPVTVLYSIHVPVHEHYERKGAPVSVSTASARAVAAKLA